MAKTAKKAKSSIATGKEIFRPWTATAVLFLGAAVILTLTWSGAQYFSSGIAISNGKESARNWSDRVVSHLSNKKQTFISKELSEYDKHSLGHFQRGANIFRFHLVDSNGKIFWSSKKEKIGDFENKSFFTEALMSGTSITTEKVMLAKNIEGTDGYSDQNQKISVIETGVPVLDYGKFVGAVFTYKDISAMLARSEVEANKLATVLSVAIALVFFLLLVIIWTYGFSRNNQARILRLAKRKAERAEKEAREMTALLQVMNDDISKLNTELNNNVKTLRETQDEVIRKGKMAQLGQLTATVAHDIRNPLGSIRTSTFLLRRKFSAANPTMDKPLTRIEKGVERCDGIITELLDFARTKDLCLKNLNFDEWLVNLVREQAESMPAEISFELALGLSDKEITFDGDSLARAIINFLSNASEAMVGKGADRVEHPTQNPKIIVSTAETERGIEISVTDNGPGISDELITKIFDPLFTTKSFGVGLGLPAVEKIFEKHGGGLQVVSTPGDGATFTGWINCQSGEKENKAA